VEIKKPLFWQQGLFLQPQHFQLNDQYIESLLHTQARFLQPHYWGVGELQISHTALENDSFEIVKGDFIFADGSTVSFPGNGILSARSFAEAWVERDRPMPVYLALKKHDASGGNVIEMANPDDTSTLSSRFVSTITPENIPDQHETGPDGQVKLMQYVLRLVWEDEKEKLGEYNLIQVGVLEQEGEEIRLAPKFVPPALSIKASEPLFQVVKEIRDLVAGRCRQLEEYKTQKGVHSAEFGSRDMVFLLALRSLNRFVPMLFHMTEPAHIHPWQVYGLLRQLIGELSAFSARVNVLGEDENGVAILPEYNQSDLGTCFTSALSLTAQLLDDITSGPEYIINLLFDGTYFTTDLLPKQFEARNRYYLVVDTEEDPAAVVQALTTIAKIGSREALPLKIAQALPGIGLEHLSIPPQELPRRVRSLYFQLDQHDDQFAQVEESNNIALYWDAAPEDLTVELMIVKGG